MKQYIIRFRKNTKLTISHNIDSDFHENPGIKLINQSNPSEVNSILQPNIENQNILNLKISIILR